MRNLLEETIAAIADSGHALADVRFIGSNDGAYSCTWKEFKLLANVEYDPGYGSAEVVTDLIVQFTDGTYMTRAEYDGSEWWNYSRPLPMYRNGKKITKLTGGMWASLDDLNGGDE